MIHKRTFNKKEKINKIKKNRNYKKAAKMFEHATKVCGKRYHTYFVELLIIRNEAKGNIDNVKF